MVDRLTVRLYLGILLLWVIHGLALNRALRTRAPRRRCSAPA
jgi:hypothetical protein